jgi:hypothetical protein
MEGCSSDETILCAGSALNTLNHRYEMTWNDSLEVSGSITTI